MCSNMYNISDKINELIDNRIFKITDDCDYRMAGAYFQNAAKMNYKPAIAALEKLILEGKYKNVQSKQTLNSNKESKDLFEKGVDYYRGRNNTKIDYVKAVNGLTMQQQKEIKAPMLIAMAVYIGKTRLIDNMILD